MPQFQARNLIDYGGIGFVQIDAGRIGGITTAKQVADYAVTAGVQFVNHTFTSSLGFERIETEVVRRPGKSFAL